MEVCGLPRKGGGASQRDRGEHRTWRGGGKRITETPQRVEKERREALGSTETTESKTLSLSTGKNAQYTPL